MSVLDYKILEDKASLLLAISNVLQFLKHRKHSMSDEQETEYEITAMSTTH